VSAVASTFDATFATNVLLLYRLIDTFAKPVDVHVIFLVAPIGQLSLVAGELSVIALGHAIFPLVFIGLTPQ